MAAFHIILWDNTAILHSLLCEEVCRDGFLQERITDVFLVTENFPQGGCQPVIASRCRFDSIGGQSITDIVAKISEQTGVTKRNVYYYLDWAKAIGQKYNRD